MVEVTSPVGRIVWGNLKGRPKLNQQRQPVLKDGQPVTQWAFGVAFAKNPNDPAFAALWQAIQSAALTQYPNGVPPNFAWKYDDGDGIDSNGKPFNQRTGYAGCIVLPISTEAFQPPICKLIGPNTYQNITPDDVKCGDYIRIALDIVGHGPKAGTAGSVPGLYINPRLVEFVAAGEAIITGPDPAAVFGGAAVQPPPGAALATQPTTAMPTGMAPAPATTAPMTVPAAPAYPGAPVPTPASAPAPQPVPTPAPAPVAAPMPVNPAAPPPAMPGFPQPAPTVSPTSVQPAPDFVQNAAGTQQQVIPAGSAIPPGWRYIGQHPSGAWVIANP